jgi:hypothetical protein
MPRCATNGLKNKNRESLNYRDKLKKIQVVKVKLVQMGGFKTSINPKFGLEFILQKII